MDRINRRAACAATSELWRRDSHTGSAFVTVSTAASIMVRCFMLPRCSPGCGDDRWRNTRLCRAVFLSPLRLAGFRTLGRRNRSEPGMPGCP